MILFYLVVPCAVMWSLSQSYLYYRGHYPSHLCMIKVPIVIGSVWLGISSVMHETDYNHVWMIYVGFLLPICASTLMVPLILSEYYRGFSVLALLQVVGYLLLCVVFCLVDAVVDACICGGCFVLVVIYTLRLVATADVAPQDQGFIEI